MQFKMSSAICFNLDQSKILSSGNELKPETTKAVVSKSSNSRNAFSICRNLCNLAVVSVVVRGGWWEGGGAFSTKIQELL